MTREIAIKTTREELDKNGLPDWHIRLTTDQRIILGMCLYKDKCILLNSFHIDTHPDIEILNTIRHEIAHALTMGHQHDEIWQNKAREINCTNTAPCSHLSFTPEIIDAIRSGADVEVTYETEVIHRPKYKITRLQDKCDYCGKVAKTVKETLIENKDETKPDEKYILLECGHLLKRLISKGTPFGSMVTNSTEEEVINCKHEWDKNQCIKCKEFRPFPFQVEGMRFLEAGLAINKGAAVFDEMGLGKTIQATGIIKFHPEYGPFLIITKSAIKFQWFKELWRFAEIIAQVIQTSKDFVIPGMKCYVASYDMFVFKTRKGKNGQEINQGFDIQKFIDAGVKCIILDECQQIKNPDASRTQEVRKLAKVCKVIALSGTPWKNRGSEFFTVLNMLAPMKFPSHDAFIRNWVDVYYDGKYTRQGGIRRIADFREYVKDIVIRREVNEVAIEMPDVNRTLHFTDLTQAERAMYNEAESEFVQWYNERGDEDNDGTMNILARMARMRHLVGLDKIPTVVEWTEQFVEETNRKLTIFVHHKDVGEILLSELHKKIHDIPIYKLTADMDAQSRTNTQDKFNSDKRAILVASTLACGEGINLQTCGDAIMMERQWNPQNEDQAAPGRFRRIGAAHKIINVVTPLAVGTIDETLHGINDRKGKAFHESMNKGEMPVWNQTAFAKELAEGIVAQWNARHRK